jgi:hypothetical protein
MAKKKKKEEYPPYFYGPGFFAPTLISIPFLDDSPVGYSFTAPSPSPRTRGTALEEGRSFGTNVPRDTGFGEAWLYYAFAGLVDPKLPAEALGWSALLGISRPGGFAVAVVVGVMVTGTILTIIDPAHKYEGGFDETRIYQAGEGGVAGSHPNLNKEIIMGGGSWGTVV